MRRSPLKIDEYAYGPLVARPATGQYPDPSAKRSPAEAKGRERRRNYIRALVVAWREALEHYEG